MQISARWVPTPGPAGAARTFLADIEKSGGYVKMPATAHPLFARLYHRLRVREDALGITATRQELLAGLTGRVVEVGAGDGANFAYYPQQVTEVVAVEPEPYLRRMAAAAVTKAPVPVTVVDGTAENLPLEAGSCDAAVTSLVLCSVRDPKRAAAELHRVLRPNGELRFYEHILADDRRLARLQRLGAPVHALISGGCRPDRDTLGHLQEAGLRIAHLRRFDFQLLPFLVLSKPHVLGTARRP